MVSSAWTRATSSKAQPKFVGLEGQKEREPKKCEWVGTDDPDDSVFTATRSSAVAVADRAPSDAVRPSLFCSLLRPKQSLLAQRTRVSPQLLANEPWVGHGRMGRRWRVRGVDAAALSDKGSACSDAARCRRAAEQTLLSFVTLKSIISHDPCLVQESKGVF